MNDRARATNRCQRVGVALTAGLAALSLAACQTKLGQGGSVASGSSGAAGDQGKSAKLQQCDEPIGTAALVRSDRSQHRQADLPSPVPVVKLMMQQSGCFKVVTRGAAGDALQRERQLAEEGELQSGSDMGEAQMKAADFVLKPSVLFQDADAGGGGAALGALLGPFSGMAVAGGLQSKQAQTLLALTNVRTGVQEAIAEGSAEKYDLAGGLGGFGGGLAGAAGAYESTDIGKVVMAAFMDAHNKLVTQVDVAKTADEREDVTTWKTAARLNMRSGASTDAPVIKTLPEGAEVKPIGDTKDGWWEVKAGGEQGWVSSDYIHEAN